MSSGGYPSSSLEHKHYNDEDEKLLNTSRQSRSQPIPQGQLFRFDCLSCQISEVYYYYLDQLTVSTPIYQQGMRTNLPEVIHIPLQYQRFNGLLDLPHAAAAIIRHSASSTRTLCMPFELNQLSPIYYLK